MNIFGRDAKPTGRKSSEVTWPMMEKPQLPAAVPGVGLISDINLGSGSAADSSGFFPPGELPAVPGPPLQAPDEVISDTTLGRNADRAAPKPPEEHAVASVEAAASQVPPARVISDLVEASSEDSAHTPQLLRMPSTRQRMAPEAGLDWLRYMPASDGTPEFIERVANSLRTTQKRVGPLWADLNHDAATKMFLISEIRTQDSEVFIGGTWTRNAGANTGTALPVFRWTVLRLAGMRHRGSRRS